MKTLKAVATAEARDVARAVEAAQEAERNARRTKQEPDFVLCSTPLYGAEEIAPGLFVCTDADGMARVVEPKSTTGGPFRGYVTRWDIDRKPRWRSYAWGAATPSSRKHRSHSTEAAAVRAMIRRCIAAHQVQA